MIRIARRRRLPDWPAGSAMDRICPGLPDGLGGTIFALQHEARIPLNLHPGEPVGDVVRFVPKSELERARLIREARAIYDSIFPPADASTPAEREREDAPSGQA